MSKILVAQISRARNLKVYKLELNTVDLVDYHYVKIQGTTVDVKPEWLLITPHKGKYIPALFVDDRGEQLDPTKLFNLVLPQVRAVK